MGDPVDLPGPLAATWLSESLLLVVGSSDVKPGETRATLVAGDESFDVDVRCIAAGPNGTAERKIAYRGRGR